MVDFIYSLPGVNDPIDAAWAMFLLLCFFLTWAACLTSLVKWVCGSPWEEYRI